MEKVVQTLDEMVQDGLIEDYVIGGATAVLYYSIPHFITEDIDVFVYMKGSKNSPLIDLSPLYNYLVSRKAARIQGEYVVVDEFPIQFLVPYDDLSKEAFAHAIEVTPDRLRFKIFSLEYSMAIMIQLGKAKYVERLRVIVKHELFDTTTLNALLERFNLTTKWTALKRQWEESQ